MKPVNANMNIYNVLSVMIDEPH